MLRGRCSSAAFLACEGFRPFSGGVADLSVREMARSKQRADSLRRMCPRTHSPSKQSPRLSSDTGARISRASPSRSLFAIGRRSRPFGALKQGCPVGARVRASTAIWSPRSIRRRVDCATAIFRRRHATLPPDSMASHGHYHRETTRLSKVSALFPQRRNRWILHTKLDTGRGQRIRLVILSQSHNCRVNPGEEIKARKLRVSSGPIAKHIETECSLCEIPKPKRNRDARKELDVANRKPMMHPQRSASCRSGDGAILRSRRGICIRTVLSYPKKTSCCVEVAALELTWRIFLVFSTVSSRPNKLVRA
jgi:hypothetical protein